MKRLLSTIILAPGELDAGELLERWRRLSDSAVDGLSIDATKPRSLQGELIHLALCRELRCGELMHPFMLSKNRRMPVMTSADRSEREAARRSIAESLELADDAAIPRLLLGTERLPLSTSIDALCRRHREVRDLELDRLFEQRSHLVAFARDAMRRELEHALERATDLDLKLALPYPAPWPHQFPSAEELAALLDEFAGSPLVAVFCADWGHIHEQTVGPLASWPRLGRETVRTADACGMTLRLSPGTGELDWKRLEPRLHDAQELVFTVDPHTTGDELTAAIALLETLTT